MKMLVPAPYQASTKKDKKKKGKEAESGLHHKGTSDAVSGGTEAPSSHEGDEDEDKEEEEEDNPPPKGRKRATSVDLEAEASKRGKISLSDDSDSDAEAIPKHRPRIKPLAESSPARDLSQLSSSSGNSLASDMMESESPPRTSPPPTTDDAKAAKVSELKQKLGLADEDLVRINKRFDEALGSAAAVKTLKGDLAQAKEQARLSQAVADKSAADLKAEQVAHRQYEEWVTEVEQALKDTVSKCESLEEKNKAQAAELAKAVQGAKEARNESRAVCEEIEQAKQIAAGKTFHLQSKFGSHKYALLTRLLSSPDAFADLSKSVADAAQFFWA
nr:nucleolar and coiled-body phosphoprotein 1-like [Aegilops tauschii subsp. strangulata]